MELRTPAVASQIVSRFFRDNPAPQAEGRVEIDLGDLLSHHNLGSVEQPAAGFIAISGPLDRRVYLEIAGAAAQMSESGVESVGVVIDSDGGSLYGMDGAVNALIRLRSKLDGRLWTFCAGHALSAAAALFFCAGKRRAVAGAGTMVGALGARMRLEDSSDQFRQELLIQPHELTAGRDFKTIGAPGVPITKDQLDFMNEQVELADMAFIEVCATARGLRIPTMDRAAGRGGMYQATLAQSLGLVDRILDEHSWRVLVEGPSSQETTMHTTPPPALPGQPVALEAPAITAPGPQAAAPAAPVAAAPPAPAVLSTPPPLPTDAPPAAAPPASPPTVPVSFATLPAAPPNQLDQLSDSLTRLTGIVSQLATGLATRDLESTVLGFADRLQAAAPSRGFEAYVVLKQVRVLVEAGQNPEELVAIYEALPPIETAAGLNAEVTFMPIAGAGTAAAPMVTQVDMSRFASPGPDGNAVVEPQTRARALEVATAVAPALTSGLPIAEANQQAFKALEKLFVPVGRPGMEVQ